MTLAGKILDFHTHLQLPKELPPGVSVMNPFADPDALSLAKIFYHRYYNDNDDRVLILGINPGRFGGGATGIPFTDPVKLQDELGINNSLPKKTELSADFVYQVIRLMGGPDVFFRKFYINSVFPLGFLAEGKNLNYYDLPQLQKAVRPFCAWSIRTQLDFGLSRTRVICLGEGKNMEFLQRLNEEHGFFREILGLPHPRFIMQYRRRYLADFAKQYAETLSCSLQGMAFPEQ